MGGSEEQVAKLERLEEGFLNALLGEHVGEGAAVQPGWSAAPLRYYQFGFNPTASEVYRVWGTALSGGEMRPWSLVAKVMHSPVGRRLPSGQVIGPEEVEAVSHPFFWRREALALRSGLFAGPHLRAPRCYAVTEPVPGEVWLWTEQLHDATPAWSLATFAEAATQLGAFNVLMASTPNEPWLSRRFLRAFLELGPAPYLMKALEPGDLWRHPLVAAAFAPSVGERVRRLWDERERLLGPLEALPQALAHLDAFRDNLFTSPAGGLAAVDWGTVGWAALGEEVAPLVTAALTRERVSLEEAEGLERLVLGGYLDGLRSSGWRGDPDEVVFAYAASAALRYTFLTLATTLSAVAEPAQAARLEQLFARSFEDTLAHRARLTQVLLERSERALALSGT